MKTRPAHALAALAVLAACHAKEPEQVATTAAVPVEVAAARRGAMAATVRVAGSIDPAPGADWTATAPERSRIVEIRYAPGDAVKAGALVARFDAPPLRADLATRSSEAAQARSRLDTARRSFDRLDALLAKGIASRREVDDARKELLDAEAAVTESGQTRAAAADLAARATPLAPIGGVVAERWHNPGDVVDAGEHVLRIIDLHRLQVTAAVPIADAPRVKAGQPARVMLPESGGLEVAGRVLGAPAVVDPATGAAPIRIGVEGRFPVGTPVQVDVEVERRANVVVVPAAAIVREEAATFAFVVGADSKAHRRAVVVGLSSEDEVQIVSGVQEGERVVVKGHDELPDGATVDVAPAASPEP